MVGFRWWERRNRWLTASLRCIRPASGELRCRSSTMSRSFRTFATPCCPCSSSAAFADRGTRHVDASHDQERRPGQRRRHAPCHAEFCRHGVHHRRRGYHHRMGLAERWTALKTLRAHWRRQPGVQSVRVGYERYGMTSDLEYFEERMQADGDSWEIVELAWPREGPGSKADRVQRLEPDFRNGRFYLAQVADDETANQKRVRDEGQPHRIFRPTRRKDENGVLYGLNKNFLDEYLTFPYCAHDDLIDAVSRIYDMDPTPPIIVDQRSLEPECFDDGI